MTVPARVSLVTLGVTDVGRATAFYVALGWPLSPASVEGEVSFFNTAGGLLALWDKDEMAEDSGIATGAVGGRRSRSTSRAARRWTPRSMRLCAQAGRS
jgi:uncharacterized protein